MLQRSRQKISRKPKNIKYYNQKLILSMFRKAEELSIAEIAAKIRLSKTTVTKVVNGFEKEGLLLVTGKGNSTDIGGKKPTMFAFNGGYTKIVVISIGIDSIRGAILDMKCNLITQRSTECPREMPYTTAVQRITEMILALVQGAGLAPSALAPLVIGCEGIIDVDSGILHYGIHHDWGQNVPLRDDIRKAMPFPVSVHVDNNLRIAGYGEIVTSESFCDFQVVVITTNHSGGGCVLENQESVHGINGFVGEFGHLIVEPASDVQCSCGGYGCFGALVSPEAILAQAKKTVCQVSAVPHLRPGEGSDPHNGRYFRRV